MDGTRRAYLELHLAVVLYGFTAILGKLISISAVSIVWWRVFFASISFLFILNVGKLVKKLPRQVIIRFMLIGIIVGLHWITFYGSIKLSNASVSLICLATTSFFTSLIEPIIVKRKFNWLELALGIVILPGMYFIVNGIDVSYYQGVIVGLASALFASLFSILNKKYIDDAQPTELAGIQLFGVFVFISVCAPILFFFNPEIDWMPSMSDVFYLVILALLCTTFAYILSMRSLRHLSAFASNLVINLEPVYGILLAAAILAEYNELSSNFYIGVGIICFAVFSYPVLKKRLKNA